MDSWLLVIIVIVVAVVVCYGLLSRRVKAIDAKLDLLLEASGIHVDIPEGLHTQVREYLRRGEENAAVDLVVAELSVGRSRALALVRVVKAEMGMS